MGSLGDIRVPVASGGEVNSITYPLHLTRLSYVFRLSWAALQPAKAKMEKTGGSPLDLLLGLQVAVLFVEPRRRAERVHALEESKFGEKQPLPVIQRAKDTENSRCYRSSGRDAQSHKGEREGSRPYFMTRIVASHVFANERQETEGDRHGKLP